MTINPTILEKQSEISVLRRSERRLNTKIRKASQTIENEQRLIETYEEAKRKIRAQVMAAREAIAFEKRRGLAASHGKVLRPSSGYTADSESSS